MEIFSYNKGHSKISAPPKSAPRLRQCLTPSVNGVLQWRRTHSNKQRRMLRESLQSTDQFSEHEQSRDLEVVIEKLFDYIYIYAMRRPTILHVYLIHQFTAFLSLQGDHEYLQLLGI